MNKVIKIFIVCIYSNALLFSTSFSQSSIQSQGIIFQNNLTWSQIKSKAKSEKKYVFIDCYATWCQPCKVMDKEVYSSKIVGDYINKYFISIKVQMDTTKKDSRKIRQWYPVANKLNNELSIKSLPTLIFMAPNGKFVHIGVGLHNDSDFVKLASDAMNSSKQYYTLLSRYDGGIRDCSEMRFAALTGKRVADKSASNRIGRDYLNICLNSIEPSVLFSKGIANFVVEFSHLIKTGDAIFKTLYNNVSAFDSAIGRPGISEAIIESILTKEEINAVLWPNKKPITESPNWVELTDSISKKYGFFWADKLILNAQIKWYEQKKAWTEVVKFNVAKIDKYGYDTSGLGKVFFNNLIYEKIFPHASDTITLNKAIEWIKPFAESDNVSSYIDTYANLLYKVGRKKEAIMWQEKAFKLDPNENEIAEHLRKMKKNEPTW